MYIRLPKIANDVSHTINPKESSSASHCCSLCALVRLPKIANDVSHTINPKESSSASHCCSLCALATYPNSQKCDDISMNRKANPVRILKTQIGVAFLYFGNSSTF